MPFRGVWKCRGSGWQVLPALRSGQGCRSPQVLGQPRVRGEPPVFGAFRSRPACVPRTPLSAPKAISLYPRPSESGRTV